MENVDKHTGKSKNTKTNIEFRPPGKLKNVPPVRQTLTSYKRMLKSNPLLKYQEAGIDVDQLLGMKSEGTSLKEVAISTLLKSKACCSLETRAKEFKEPEVRPLRRIQSLKIPRSNGLDVKGTHIISGNLPLTDNHFKKASVATTSLSNNTNLTAARPKPNNTSNNVSNKVEYKKLLEPKIKNLLPKCVVGLKSKSKNSTNKETESKNLKPKLFNKDISSLRRSFSSDELSKIKCDNRPTNSQIKQISNVCPAIKCPDISPIADSTSDNKKFVFKSPSAYERRSIGSFTPHSTRKSSIFEASTPALIEMDHLKERLAKWLKSRKTPVSSFKNLRFFGNDIFTKNNTLPTDDENKENINSVEEKLKHHENAKIISTPESSKVDEPIQNDATDAELCGVAKNAMVELQELIREDYPRAQCLGWLELIKEKYTRADEEPEYWECKAAIEQSVGNVGNALEFYKTAIIQGAEVSAVDKSLDQLLKKFSLLNISPNKLKQKKVDGNKERIVREARTVFKSTIIQCAVHERKLKKFQFLGGRELASYISSMKNNIDDLIGSKIQNTAKN